MMTTEAATTTRALIKVKAPGAKTWAFLSRGGTNRLRVHASQFASVEKARALIDENAADNPGWEWKVVPLA